MRLQLLCYLLSLQCHVSFSHTPAAQVQPRTLLQTRDRSRITVRNAAELGAAARNVEHGQTVVIEAPELLLNEPVLLDGSDVSVIGSESRRPTLRCAEDANFSAVQIRQGFARVANLDIAECRGASAVEIRPDAVAPRVVFENVTFRRNGNFDGVFGGAVRVAGCDEGPCTEAASLTLRSCQFEKNVAVLGGGLFCRDADVKVVDCHFADNEAAVSGGAVYVRNRRSSFLRIRASRFVNNSARAERNAEADDAQIASGGAVYARDHVAVQIDASYFRHNLGCAGGGAVAVRHEEIDEPRRERYLLKVTASTFEDNSALCGPQTGIARITGIEIEEQYGGALLFHVEKGLLSDWSIESSTFRRNHARLGGSIYVDCDKRLSSRCHIKNSTFSDDVALKYGGSLATRGVKLTVQQSVFRNGRAMVGGCIWLCLGSYITVPPPATRADVTRVEGGIAAFGGGIVACESSGFDLSRTVIQNNTGYRVGGGIRVDSSVERCALRGTTLKNNRALVGGGVAFILATNVTITDLGGKRSRFLNNTASVGGAFHYEPGSTSNFFSTIEMADFKGNRALRLTHPEIAAMLQLDADFQPLPGTDARPPSLQRSQSSLLKFLVSAEDGRGGGLYFTFDAIRPFSLVEFDVRNVTVRRNEAVVGGGIFLSVRKDSEWNQARRASCLPIALGLEACRKFTFRNVAVTKNRAEFAAGIFSSLPDGIAFSCRPMNVRSMWTAGRARAPGSAWHDALAAHCSQVSQNNIVDGADVEGVDYATNAVSLSVVDPPENWNGTLVTVASAEMLQIACGAANGCRETTHLTLSVRDALGQVVQRGVADAEAKLRLESESIFGDFQYTAVNGTVVIDRTKAWGIGIPIDLTVFSERDPAVRLELRLRTRDCLPGEIEAQHTCDRCPADMYGFHPALRRCTPCERNARCTGSAVLVPHDGYWHSNPFSPVIRPCILSTACSYDGRIQNLTAFHERVLYLQEGLALLNQSVQRRDASLLQFEGTYPQCVEGYRGLLCGSCRSGYGRAFNGECTECAEDRGSQKIRIWLSTLYRYLFIGLNCWITIVSMNTRVKLVEHELMDLRPTIHPELRRIHFGRKNLLRRSKHISFDRISMANSGAPWLTDIFAKQLFSAVLLTETLKILINYLQVTSTALRLSTEWGTLLRTLLSIDSLFSGVTSALFAVPYECRFQDRETPASIASVWMRLVTPWIVLVALLLSLVALTAVKWTRSYCRREILPPYRRDLPQFMTYFIVISVVSTYISYIDVVRELLRTVNCLRIKHPENVARSHEYYPYATEPVGELRWAEDTDIVCFQGRHLPLAVVGIVGLIFTLCGIITIAIWLPLNRKHKTEKRFVARYWFLYQAYKPEWYRVAWESTVLSRKVLISVVIVFSAHLGPDLQAVMCAGILAAALALQSCFVPFKIPENVCNVPPYAGSWMQRLGLEHWAAAWRAFNDSMHLNILESVSLASSILMFYAAVILKDPSTTVLGRTLTAVLTFLLNSGFTVYMAYRLYAGLHVLLDLKLQPYKVAQALVQNNSLSLSKLLRKMLTLIRVKRGKHRPTGDESLPRSTTSSAPCDAELCRFFPDET